MRKTVFFLLVVMLSLPMSLGRAQETCETGLRPFEDANGTVCIPEAPERVVVFDTAAYELLLALEQAPVLKSAFLEDFFLSVFPELAENMTALTGEVADMGFPINQEVLLEANPDVIITNVDFAAAFPETVSEIAPLVVLPTDISWKDKLLQLGDVLGETETVETMLSDYETRMEAFREVFPDAAEIEVSLARVQAGQFNLIMPTAFGSEILAEAGFSRPESQMLTGEESLELYGDADEAAISEERLDLLDADVILLYNAIPNPDVRAENQEMIDALADDPLFSTLNASQNGQVFQVGGYWYGQGIYSAHGTVDDLFRYLADMEPTVPNPLLPVIEGE